MAFILPTSSGSTVGGSTSAPPSPATDSARGAFDDHLKRAGQPSTAKEPKRPAPSDAAPRADKPATDTKPDAVAAAPARNTPAEDQAPAEASDSQQPVADAHHDAGGDQQDQQSTGETVIVAAITVEQAAAPVIDEVTIETTDAPNVPEQPVVGGEKTTDTTTPTKVAIEQAVAQTPDAEASIPAPSAPPVAVVGPTANQAKPASKPLSRFAAPTLRTLEEAVKVKKEPATQTVTEDSNAPEVRPVAVQQVAAASATPAMVTIVSAAHEALSNDAESEHSNAKVKPPDAPAAQLTASVVAAAIQVPLPAAPASQLVDLGSDATPQAKRTDADPDPAKPTDSVPQTPPPTAGVDNTGNNNRLQTNFQGHSLLRTEGSSGTSEVDRIRFVQRVAKAFRAAEDQGGQIRLRLNPPELGAVKLEITMKAGVMTAKLEAETPAARSMLLDNLPALRERLAEQNVRVEKFDVDVMDRQSGGMPDATPDDSERGQRSPRNLLGAEKQEETAEPVLIGGRILVDSGQLNVVI